jgi:serine/threonine protein kinase
MGSVYRAVDELLGRRVALKTMKSQVAAAANGPADADDASRAIARSAIGDEHSLWLQEAQSLARVSHPNIVAIYDVGTARSVGSYLAMEYIDGPTLRTWLASEKRKWRQICRIMIAAGEGLAAAHRVGVIHRDFKPDNILVSANDIPKVADFGLAKFNGGGGFSPSTRVARINFSDANGVLTRAGEVAGTPAFMAPEQIVGDDVDERADIFAFCVTLYQALYGVRPFAGVTLNELLESIAKQEFAAGSKPQGAPKGLHSAVVRGLAYQRSDRYASMEEALQAISASVEGAKFGPRMSLGLAGFTVLAASIAVPTWRANETLVLDNRCASDRAGIAADWSKGRRVEIARRFLHSGLSYGDHVFSTLDAKLNHFAESWEGVRQKACLQAQEASTNVESMRALRLDALRQLDCLGRIEVAVDSFSDALSRATEKVVSQSIASLQNLPDPTLCLSVGRTPADRTRGPNHRGTRLPEPLNRSESAGGQETLLGARIKRQMGVPDEADAMLSELMKRARQNLDIELLGAAALEESKTLIERRRFDAAKSFAWVALAYSTASDDPETRFGAGIELFLSIRDPQHPEFEAALEAEMRRRGADARHLAQWYAARAETDRPQGAVHWHHPNEARRWLDAALEGFIRAYGHDSPHVQNVYEKRAQLESVDFGDWNAARFYLERAIAIQNSIGGEEHPDRIRLWLLESEIRESSGDYGGALESAKAGANLSNHLFGAMNLANAEPLSRYSTVLRIVGHYRDAAKIVRQLESIYANVWGRDDWRASYFRGRTLAGLERYAGRYLLAGQYLREWNGENLTRTQSVLQPIDLAGEAALESARLGEFALADHFLAASAIYSKEYIGPSAPATWLALWARGLLAAAQGRDREASELLEQAVVATKDESALSEGGVLISDLYCEAAQARYRSNNRKGAYEALDRAYSLIVKESGPDSHRLAEVEDARASFAYDDGDFSRAFESANQALALHDEAECSSEAGAWRRFALARAQAALREGDMADHVRVAANAAAIFQQSEWLLAPAKANLIRAWISAAKRSERTGK